MLDPPRLGLLRSSKLMRLARLVGQRCLMPVSGAGALTRARLQAPVLSALLLAGCTKPLPPLPAQPPIPSGQTLRVYTFAEYFGASTLSQFEAETGNKVTVDSYRTNEDMLKKLEQEPSRYDVIFPSSYAVEYLIRQGKLAEMQRERVPNLVHVMSEFRNPPYDPSMLHCIPYAWWVAGLGYLWNQSHPVSQPESLTTVFGPQGAEVAWMDDMRATMGMALRSLGHSPSSQQASDLLEVQRLLTSSLPRVVGIEDDPTDLLRTKRVELALGWSTDAFSLKRSDPNVRFTIPREGTLLYVDYACVLKSSEHAAVAFAFLNHLLSPTVAAEISNTRMLPMPNEPARRLLDTEMRWMWGTFEALRTRSHSYEALRDVGPAQPQYDKIWHELKAQLALQQQQRQAAAAEAAEAKKLQPSIAKKPASATSKSVTKRAAQPSSTSGQPTQKR